MLNALETDSRMENKKLEHRVQRCFVCQRK
jgi:hypothetical protein